MVKSSQGGDWIMKSRLKQLMLERAAQEGELLTQTKIAKETGLDNNTISTWMSDNPIKTINTRVAGRLCRYFGVGLGELVIFEEPEESGDKEPAA